MTAKNTTSGSHASPEGKTYTEKEMAVMMAKAKEEAKAEAVEEAKVAAEETVKGQIAIIQANAKAEAMKELAKDADKKALADDYVPKPGKLKHYFSKVSDRNLVFPAFNRFGNAKKGPEVQFQLHRFKTNDENLQKLIESSKAFKNGKISILHPDVAARLEGKPGTEYIPGAAHSGTAPEGQKGQAVIQ
jgi:hypothetical protein